MELLSTYHLRRWVDENKEYFQPPLRTNKLLLQHKDFLVMILRGPNARLDFHVDPGDEFFYQVEGRMELHLKPASERRHVIAIEEGEIFVCPGGLAHSPRRFEGTWGLVIERPRRTGETEEFVWFCERCDALMLSRTVTQGRIPAQVAAVYREFNSNETLRTCRACGYTFPVTPMAERLQFLNSKK
ncbi:MAG TPA: 3-hydroxyanthranilate 3,4-dioxygenase [Terriglobales bacterium]|jgi:3-hydroxyanthranilate 3,4-dioxygenase|nr:3-hydroxyanthranilate 3,4-dioxygenase [Terriglobales bacterium]